MGKFLDRFKVRQPGKGNVVQKVFEGYTRAKITITDKGKDVPNGGQKTSV